MIPDLKIDSETEGYLWDAFNSWADHFKLRLAEKGVPGLIVRYRELIESVESETCKHGPGGTTQTGADWRFCCGISYEYWNDLSVRDALEKIIDLVPQGASAAIESEIPALDDRLYRMIDDPPPREGAWWSQKLPRTICE